MTNPNPDQPLISVDVVPVFISPDGKLRTVLGRRLYEPYFNDYALPGVLLSPEETLHEAAKRALRTKVSVPSSIVGGLQDVGAFDSTNRDPRGASVSITYIAALQANESFLKEVEVSDKITTPTLQEAFNMELPFDHNTIIDKAVETMTEKFWHSKDFTRALLGEKFTTQTVKKVMLELEDAHESPLYQQDLQNLTRKLQSAKFLQKSEDKIASTTPGRPSSSWEWC